MCSVKCVCGGVCGVKCVVCAWCSGGCSVWCEMCSVCVVWWGGVVFALPNVSYLHGNIVAPKLRLIT